MITVITNKLLSCISFIKGKLQIIAVTIIMILAAFCFYQYTELKQASTVKTEIVHDTTVIVKSPDFELVIKPNSLTSIIINKKDSLLTHKLNIENVQTLFVTQERVYRRKYKNWFARLIHFDFKKKTQLDYQIHNSNDIINTKDTKLIEIVK